ncbi:MAG: RNA polymerase sigma factor [Bacillota bacterium]|nr:RNA polymerase sigma factor [Bacillota bacterium]
MVDIELIEKVKNGDRPAFRSLFNNHRDKVARTAFLILKDNQHVEEVVQETFLQVCQKIKKLSDPTLFEGWLYKITVNQCFQILRKQRKMNTSSLDQYVESGFEVNTGGFTPEDIILANDTKEKLLKAIYSLPTKYTLVVILYYYNNFSVKEIADIIKESESNVKTRLFRARKMLEKSLREDFGVISRDSDGGALYEYR